MKRHFQAAESFHGSEECIVDIHGFEVVIPVHLEGFMMLDNVDEECL